MNWRCLDGFSDFVVIGKPIDPAGRDVQSLTNEVETWIEQEVERLGRP